MSKRTIKNKIILISLMLTILLGASLTTWTFYTFKNSILNSKFADLEKKTNILIRNVNCFVTTQKDTLNLIETIPHLKENLTNYQSLDLQIKTKLNKYLHQVTKSKKTHISEVFLLDKNGDLVTTTLKSHKEKHMQNSKMFLHKDKNIKITGPIYTKQTHEYYMIFTKALYDDNDFFLGNIILKANLKGIYAILTDKKNLEEKEEIYIINRKGFMVSPSRFLKQVILKQKVITPNTIDFIKKNKTIKQPTKAFLNYRNAFVFGRNQKIEVLDWLCIAEINRHAIFNPLVHITIGLGAIIIISMLLFLLAVHYFFAPFYNTLHIIINNSTKIAHGDLSTPIPKTNLDEFTQITDNFNDTIKKMQNTQQSLIDTQNNLAEKIKEKTIESENAKKAALSLMQDANMEKETTKYTLRKLQYTTEKMRNLSQAIEQSPIIVLITDKDTNIVYVNPKMTEVTGYTKEETLGKSLDFIINKKKDSSPYQRISKKIAKGEGWKGVFENNKKDGEMYWERASITPVFNESEAIINYVVIKEDITLGKQYEEALKESKKNADNANKAKSDFLRNINHEIRNPMNAIIGMTHLVLNSDLPEKEQGYISKIQNSAESLIQVVNDILDYSKFEADNIEINKTEFNINDILDNISNILSTKAQEKNLEFLYKINPNLPQSFKGDPVRISQVLLNITSNAIKFTNEGHIIIDIDIIKQTKDKMILSFSVEDTGIGLSEEEIKKLFNAFTQADTSTTREHDGTGLGLYISQKIIKKMHGDINVKSKKDQGSTFYFTIELNLIRDAEMHPINEPSSLKNKKALIIDKSSQTLDIMEKTLKHFSAEITTSRSMEESLETLTKHNDFDLIIANWELSDGQADKFLAKLKEKNISPNIPIIIMSNQKSSSIQEQAQAFNIKNILYKPFTLATLYKRINICLFPRQIKN